ncbi:peptidylprolyl isomerase [Bryobacter aggregatus]|uniref:peptidylprolyl isomerase n=1 Tax=Bryobacter aggregatus TaxID=360054 RepID=UPI0012BB08EC|nr:peptidylprolyl isomerase [Bryobacter aggregatus]
MKKSVLLLALSASFAFAQDKPVATINGKPISGKELEDFSKGLPPQFQQFYAQDKEGFLKQYAVLMKFSTIAEANKVDQQTPYKQRLEFTRLQILAQALVEDHRNKIAVTDEELKAFYDKNKENYTQAKLQVILVNFSDAPAKEGEKKKLTETEAETKANALVKQLKAGADFKKLVAENSDDVASKAKGGEFGVIRRSDDIPDALKMAIFALKQGEVSEPVKQPNGFYIFKVTEYTAQPFEEVKSVISSQTKDQKFQEWLKVTQDTADVKVMDQAFFGKTAAPPAPATPPAAAPKKP